MRHMGRRMAALVSWLWLMSLLISPPVEAIKATLPLSRVRGLEPCAERRFNRTKMEVYGQDSDGLLKQAGIDGVYIAHWTRFTTRRTNVEEQLRKHGIKGHIITGYDGEDLVDGDLECLYPSNELFHNLATSWKFAANWLHTGELSLCIKHIAAYYNAVQKGYKNILVLEDDFTVDNNFKKDVLEVMNTKKSWEDPTKPMQLLFLGSYHSNWNVDLWRQRKTELDPMNRGTIGYVISRSGMLHVLQNLPITAPSDHMLSNGMTRTAPPNRYVHMPWLVQPHDDFGQKGKGLGSPKRSHWIRTPDIQDCVGTKCPCTKPANISRRVIRGGCCCKASKVP